MLIWLAFASLSALGFSIFNALAKYAAGTQPKLVVAFFTYFTASVVLFIIAFFRGIPTIGDGFLLAVLGTAVLNIIAFPVLLKAYQWGEFSSVFPMLLLTPVLMVGTSFLILREVVSVGGVLGMLITVAGLWIVGWYSGRGEKKSNVSSQRKGIMLGLLVAVIFSFSTNFDKLVITNSDGFFGPAVAAGAISLGMLPLMFILSKDDFASLLTNLPKRSTRILILLGFILAVNLVVFYTALSLGLASYTVLVKRMGIIFGVLWGWLFFKEKNITAKLVGVLIALGGLAIIILIS